jgi:hypothetical protein
MEKCYGCDRVIRAGSFHARVQGNATIKEFAEWLNLIQGNGVECPKT